MDRVKEIVSLFQEFLTYKLIDGKNVDISVATLASIVIVLIAVTFILRLISKVMVKKLPVDDKNKFLSLFGFLKYFLYILSIITILHSSGVDLTVLLTASAALFVGLGFALQYLFQDIISGILIILDQSLHIGDIIEIDGKVGRVFETRLRTTRALTRDDKVIVIPNHKFLTDTIYNYTQNHKTTRESVKIGVAYGSDVQLVTKLLLEIVLSQKGILKSPKPFVLFEDFGDSALMFSVNYFTNDSYGDPRIKSDLRYLIDASFRNNNISIPFPQRDIHIIGQNRS
ncbi:mechanosensitive ion channel [Cellulophaga sp. F20128]|uniref:mechanosensitive ion channel family protein n=1 Tax=Cellulophaga sp. F20128 TaxID=2926413 RepID=UPI001FF3DAFE|nr:mechanosensitive ion channel domain-containing protein [Cellulophaga sp. F20128]MCK0158495.1 mechanosensitive ion channel [Cellulophaga sp. F20128]